MVYRPILQCAFYIINKTKQNVVFGRYKFLNRESMYVIIVPKASLNDFERNVYFVYDSLT